MTFEEFFNHRYKHVRNPTVLKSLRVITKEAWDAAEKTFKPPVIEPSANDLYARRMLSDLVRMGASPAGISLATQLLGVAPCPTCNYRKLYCRCEKESNAG